jgi:hypothetical protein
MSMAVIVGRPLTSTGSTDRIGASDLHSQET